MTRTFYHIRIATLFIFILASSAHAQVFFPVQDAYVHEYSPFGNFGDAGWLWVYSDLWYQGTVARSLVQFDLTSIPPGTPIQAAQLNIYMFNQAGTDMTVELHSVLQPWNEMTVTWSNQPVHDTGNVAALPYQSYGWWHFPVTGIVQAWVNNPSINRGLKLMLEIEHYPDSLGRAAYFYSRDTSLERPNLEVIPQDIEEQKGSAAVGACLVHPNPAREYFIVCLPHSLDRSVIRLYDMTGKKVKEITCNAGVVEKRIALTDISPGVYFIEINGKMEQKVIKVK